MIERIENFVERLLPDIAREANARKRKTEDVVKKSHDARTASEDNLFAAYRQIGVATSKTGHPRKWD